MFNKALLKSSLELRLCVWCIEPLCTQDLDRKFVCLSVSKHAVLKVDLQKKLPAVGGNSAQLGQVVMNL